MSGSANVTVLMRWQRRQDAYARRSDSVGDDWEQEYGITLMTLQRSEEK